MKSETSSMADIKTLLEIKSELKRYQATLVAVSKTKPNDEIMQVYQAGHKSFGENYVQELTTKQQELPSDMEWHYIGHLQSNKVKLITPFIHLIHGIDSEKLLSEINKQALRESKKVNCLLQIYIAEEESKFGLDKREAEELLIKKNNYPNVNIKGFMGMATNTDSHKQIEKEFNGLHTFFNSLKEENNLSVLSMGMTSDYKIALNCGSNIVRIGSAIFGSRK